MEELLDNLTLCIKNSPVTEHDFIVILIFKDVYWQLNSSLSVLLHIRTTIVDFVFLDFTHLFSAICILFLLLRPPSLK